MNLTLRPFTLATLQALAQSDADAASALFGFPLPDELVAETWVWNHYAELLAERPEVAGWITEAILLDDVVVGYAGFHQPANEAGEVELGYTVLAPYRRRGIAKAMVGFLVDLATERRVPLLTAYVSPDNEASVAVLRSNGFTYVRDVQSERHGRQLMFERRPA